jgi:hypothetical protein
MAPVQVVFAGVGSAVRSGLLETQVRPVSAENARVFAHPLNDQANEGCRTVS